MKAHWTEVEDSFFSANSYGAVQEKGVRCEYEEQPISEIDKLNGIESAGRIQYLAKAQRQHYRNGWTEWQAADMFASYNYKKVNGKLNIDGLWYMGQGPLGGTYMAPSQSAITQWLSEGNK